MTTINWIEGEIPRPGTCISCGSADHKNRRFVSFTKWIRHYGKVLLCSECVNSIIALPGLDMVPRIDLEMATTEAKVYRDSVEPALDALRNIRTGFDELCNDYLNADGSPKKQTVSFFGKRRTGAKPFTGNTVSDGRGLTGLFDKDPGPAA